MLVLRRGILFEDAVFIVNHGNAGTWRLLRNAERSRVLEIKVPSSICDVETRTEEEGLTLGLVSALGGWGKSGAKIQNMLDPQQCHKSLRSKKGILTQLGGGFKYFLFSPLFGEDSRFD